MADSIRGDGLFRAQRALAALEGDPLRLDRERQRFSHSPPPYTSNPSGTTTLSQSPNPPSEEQQLRNERRSQLSTEWVASQPYYQFSDQVEEERRRMWRADPRTSWMTINPGDQIFKKEAHETVKKSWVEQGIWNKNWSQFALGRWKHEEPLELESESETDSEGKPPSIFFPSPSKPKPRRSKSDEEKRRIAERRVVREREREASRPCHQFVYQISKERERIQEESANGEGADAADIDMRAYENVKNTWTQRGIWNGKWATPGMSWKHEQPFEEYAVDILGPVPAEPFVNGGHEAGEAPAIRIFGSPSPVKSNYRQASGTSDLSQQGPPADIDSAGLENGDAERSSFTSNSPPLGSGKRVLRPATGKALLPSKRKASRKNGQPVNASLGPVHSSRISKAASKRKGPQRRLNISQKASSDGLPLCSGVDAAEPQPSSPPIHETLRRSKRIQPPVSGVAKDPANTASTDPPKRAVRLKPERKVASSLKTRSSANPRGVSKRQSSKTTRGKARQK